jgi:hypothetical protein
MLENAFCVVDGSGYFNCLFVAVGDFQLQFVFVDTLLVVEIRDERVLIFGIIFEELAVIFDL